MLEGLEATEYRFKSLNDIIDYRIEAEFFLKKFLLNDSIRLRNKCYPFINCFAYRNGLPYNSESFKSFQAIFSNQSSNDYEIAVARIGDVTNKRDIELWDHIPMGEFILQKGELLSYGDILMTLTGDPPDVGKVHFIFSEPNNATWNQRITNIKILNKQLVSSQEYAYALLSTDFCRTQIERFAKGIRQRNLGNEGLENVAIPFLPINIQKRVKEIVLEGIEKYNIAKSSYHTAEEYLSECLGMKGFSVSLESNNVKTLKNSLFETGRFDAEYYLPRYEDYCRLLKAYSNGYESLYEVCNIKDANFIPETGVNYKYIELANIGKSGEIVDCNIQNGEDLPTRARRIVHYGDVIVSSIEGSLDSCALVTEDYEGALCSTGFYVLRSSVINPETLLVLFKSLPMRQLMKQGCSGTILTAISKQEFEKLPIPIIPQDVQIEIAKCIQNSFALRKESTRLFNEAKTMLEEMIRVGDN